MNTKNFGYKNSFFKYSHRINWLKVSTISYAMHVWNFQLSLSWGQFQAFNFITYADQNEWIFFFQINLLGDFQCVAFISST